MLLLSPPINGVTAPLRQPLLLIVQELIPLPLLITMDALPPPRNRLRFIPCLLFLSSLFPAIPLLPVLFPAISGIVIISLLVGRQINLISKHKTVNIQLSLSL